MAGSLVFVDDALVGHGIDYRYGAFIGLLGQFLVAVVDSVYYLFDGGAHA